MRRTGEIGRLQGELRAVHLQTHLAQRAILTPAQTEQYDDLRGYRGNAAATPHYRQHEASKREARFGHRASTL